MLGVLVVVAWLTGVSAASGAELLVSAAISLKEPLQEIGMHFERRHPDVKVAFNWGASGALQRQIEQGAPVDVYVSAAPKQMNDLAAEGLILSNTRHTLAVNVVALITHAAPKPYLHSFEDLTKPEVRLIAIGNPRSVPAGEYARAILTSLSVWEILQPKLILAENVRQALAYVLRGEVDAALVYATDAKRAGEAVRVVAAAPEGSYPPVLYPIAAVTASTRPALARAFVDLAVSEVGQQILKTHGFLPLPTGAAR